LYDFQKKIIDFLDELGLFIEEKPIFTKKKNLSLCCLLAFMAVHMKNFVRPIFERCLKVRSLLLDH
jgi:hypothetical protein